MTSTEQPNLDNMSPEDRKAYEKYGGRLPKQSALLAKKDKKFFDSADWAKSQHEAKGTTTPSETPIKE
ncbi:hypothetical protein DFA_02180 [Cavenderia fasciculata]|uniref:Uncharacterized protein n=1 Tax=Cavenderia fasciculata TaxID=261658 RepID=F4PYC6_CACFS|nr:uncharacterized protein DFA_02180 [Cavenderia fasciculata]EGG19393.1 hypothetical protein DFA_02180 [Cavenderia fasciculata]|eukprot:XP_004357664.1 hypothetical protein DFA_02180 [Cavenderia fasciculata]